MPSIERTHTGTTFTDSYFEVLMQEGQAATYVEELERTGFTDRSIRDQHYCRKTQRLHQRGTYLYKEYLVSMAKQARQAENSGDEMAVGKEMRDLLDELKELNFTWEITGKNHVKATAPDGELIVFSVGGRSRSEKNQRAILNRWKRNNQPEEIREEDVAQPYLSPTAVAAIEAMVATIVANERHLASIRNDPDDAREDLVAENELLTEEVQRLERIAEERLLSIEALEAKIFDLKNEIGALKARMVNMPTDEQIYKDNHHIEELEKEVERLRSFEAKFKALKKALT